MPQDAAFIYPLGEKSGLATRRRKTGNRKNAEGCNADRATIRFLRMLARCPICGYSLCGLPDRYRCPECGFDYDQRMEVIEQSATLAVIFVGSLAMAAVGLFILWPIRLRGLSVVFAPFGLAYMVWYVTRFFTGYRNKVVIGPDGIRLLQRRRVHMQLPWSQISRVTGGRGSVEIRDRHDHILHSVTEGFLGSDNRLKQFREVATAFLEDAGPINRTD